MTHDAGYGLHGGGPAGPATAGVTWNSPKWYFLKGTICHRP